MIAILSKKSDELGALSSFLCILHCVATPVLLTILPVSSLTEDANQHWWGWLDIPFLFISGLAVFWAIQRSPKTWIQISMAVSFLVLGLFVVNERFIGFEFPVDLVYFPASLLIVLHLVNRKYCSHRMTNHKKVGLK